MPFLTPHREIKSPGLFIVFLFTIDKLQCKNHRSFVRTCIGFVILFFLSTHAYGQNSSDTLKAKDLVQLSFEDLMNIQIKTGTLINLERSKSPTVLTVITSEDIENTPARNMLDLLEVFVPGGTYVNHWLGPRIGMRGIMSDQNNSFLLIVDGENMNMQYENGPLFEIQNKDLSDIEKIEIINGPGSVTYGPGAIGGVISITTKSPKTADKLNIGLEHNLTYRYSILNSSVSIKKKKFSAYMFGSVGTSRGIKNPEFYYIDRAHGYGFGYMSESWGNKGLGTPAPNFYADFQKRPEIKAQLNIDFSKEFTFRARYTSFSFIQQQQQIHSEEGPAFPGQYGQQFTSSLKNNHKFSEKIQLESSLGFQSQSLGNIRLYQGANKPFDDITQRNNSFSENKMNFRSLLSHQALHNFEMAFGVEYNYWFYKPEWGKAENTFLMNFAPPLKFAVSDSSSGFYKQYNPNGLVTIVENSIDAHQISGFYEFNYQPIENTTILFSGRIDKHNLARLAFSPRVALIQQLNKNNYLKLIAQQSVRLPNFRELYAIEYSSGPFPAPEKLRGIELIFSSVLQEDLALNISAFYRSIDQIAWSNNIESEFTGTFDIAGFEADLAYKWNGFNMALNYSFIKQLEWNPAYEFSAYLSNIGTDSLDIPLTDAGSMRINNFPQHQLKLVTSYKINTSLFVHFNARFASGYGQIEMLQMFKSVHDQYGSLETQEEMSKIYDDVFSKGYSRPSFTSDLSLSYTMNLGKVDLLISTWIMNLFAVNHIRYVYQYWEEGNNRQYPRQIGFVEEPRSIGFSFTAKF